MSLSDFSVVYTNVELSSDGNILKKTYSLNVDIDLAIDELKKLMDDYLYSLISMKIRVPRIIDSRIEEEKIIYECEYCGKNIIELGLSLTNYEQFKPYFIKMIGVIALAKFNDIYFDPHPKNFVFNEKKEIFYVDFFPPYSDYLLEKRLKIAEKDEIKIITENYNYFTKNNLMQHFCGDFLNIDRNFDCIFKYIYNLVKELGFYNKSLDQFIFEARKIRETEDLRLQKNIYLL
jgi:hypothetical protein